MSRISKILFLVVMLMSASSASYATKRALVIGLGEQLDPAWGKIHGDNDVAYVNHFLQKAGYTDIRTLKNREATKVNIVAAFKRLATESKSGDKIYVHYSGHGQLMTDIDGDEALKWNGSHAQWDESWIPYDAYMTYCKQDRGEKHLCDDEIAELLQGIRNKIGRSGQLIVVVDACHSGDSTMGEDDEECVRGAIVKFQIPLDPQAKKSMSKPERWLTVSACQPYQLSSEIKGMKVGKLTYAIYKLGMGVLNNSNIDLEKALGNFIEKYNSRIKQKPMVRGRK